MLQLIYMSLYDCKVLGSSDIEVYFTRIKALGEGGYGEVYLASTTDLARSAIGTDLPAQVAIKKLKLKVIEGNTRASARENIINELSMLKSLDFKYCLKYYGCFENDDYLYIVMEYLQGRDLFDHINDHSLSTDEKIMVAKQIALGIKELHEADYVHRDLKPENIMVVTDPELRVVLLDYAFMCNMKAPWSGCSVKMGSPAYFDWKSTPGDSDSMKLADWWAFGQILVILFLRKQLLTNGKYARLTGDDIRRLPDGLRVLVVKLTDNRVEQTERPSPDEIMRIIHNL
jgi:serine/threonine protein kinase